MICYRRQQAQEENEAREMGLLYGPNGLLSMNGEAFPTPTDDGAPHSSTTTTPTTQFHQSPATAAFTMPGAMPGVPLASLPGLTSSAAGKFGGPLPGLPSLHGMTPPEMRHDLTGAMAALHDMRKSPERDVNVLDHVTDEERYSPGKI